MPNNRRRVCSTAQKQSTSLTEGGSLAELTVICGTAGATRPLPDSSEPFTKYRKKIVIKCVISKRRNSGDRDSVVRRVDL